MSTPEVLDDPFTGVTAGNLEVRLSRSAEEVDAAQALRYRVFYDEMDAVASPEMKAAQRDIDSYDSTWDHLLVIDRERPHPYGSVIGTYRLNRRSVALRNGGFYTASEYDVSPLMALKGEIMELGRSCVDADYRNRATMTLLWRGIAAYVFHYDIDLMFGCASIPGIDPDDMALPLSFLYHRYLAPAEIRPSALPHLAVPMNRLAADEIDKRAALRSLPPLIKGYLRLGGFVGDGAVVDHQFHTTDVCIVVKTDLVTAKYRHHYGADTHRPIAG
jgi:putative hemolysin